MTTEHTLIFTGGETPHANVHLHFPDDAFIIAADSGYEHAVRAGHVPHLLVGDMDSISANHLTDARERGIEIVEYSSDKDLTDTEIALAAAIERGSVAIAIVSGGGDRFDHVIAMLHSLASFSALAQTTVFVGSARIRFLTPNSTCVIDTVTGDTISLIPLGGNAIVTTTGLQWNLTSDTLEAFASRGVSNRSTHSTVTITSAAGTLAIIQPFFLNSGDSK